MDGEEGDKKNLEDKGGERRVQTSHPTGQFGKR